MATTRDTSKARAARAARAAGKAGKAPAPTGPASPGPRARATSSAWLVGLGVALVAAVVWGLARLSPAWRLAGLVPWTGGGVWAVRSGQWIDPAAAASLTQIGKDLRRGDPPLCAALPLTLDVSLEAGGAYKRHMSHRTGRDVDIRAPAAADKCFVALIKALLTAGWEIWYGGPGADQIAAPSTFHRDPIHRAHLHARFKG